MTQPVTQLGTQLVIQLDTQLVTHLVAQLVSSLDPTGELCFKFVHKYLKKHPLLGIEPRTSSLKTKH